MNIHQTIEFIRHAILFACLAGLVVCILAILTLSLVRVWRSNAIQSLLHSGCGVGLAVLAVVMMFNGYPTHADKKRAGYGTERDQSRTEGEQRSGAIGGNTESSFECATADFAEAPSFPAWTNAFDSVCVTGIVLDPTSVWIRVSWPSNESLPNSMLDVYSALDCATNIWAFCATVPVSATTNEVVIVAFIPDAFIAEFPRCFFRVEKKTDSDGDGLTDAYERLVSQTSPVDPDSDGDGIPDGWELLNGLNPNSWPDSFADPDGDGIPNIYEYHNGTLPQVSDAEQIERIVAGGSGTNAVATLSEALAASRPYSVIEVADGVHEGDGWSGFKIRLPDYPVLITSADCGRSRRAIIRHNAQMAAMYLNATQTTHTVVRGLSYYLAATNGMQMAFWCGGNLPWSGSPAAGMFRDIYVRMPNPGVEYEGWFFRHYESNKVVIASCTVNASGATNARGIYAVDSPTIEIENCTFVNFPPNDDGLGYGIQYESTAQNWGDADDPITIKVVNCLFDASFTNAYALAPIENGVAYDVTMKNCIVPSSLEYTADFADGLIVTNAGTSFSGHITENSPARCVGDESLYAALDIDGQDRAVSPDIGADQFIPDTGMLDTDGDGLTDADEDWIYGTDPYFMDSDWDGSPDNAEIANGTDPLDRLSHKANVSLTVINTAATQSLTNYFGFSWTATGWDVTNVFATTSTGQASLVLDSTSGLYGKAFSDLNRNGVYDAEVDVIQVVSLENEFAVVNAKIMLGDMDADGISDATERIEGTDPYDSDNFFMRATVRVSDVDSSNGITNYIAHYSALSAAVPVATNPFVSETKNYPILSAVTEGKVYVRGFRDLNKNGIYDDGVDGVFIANLSQSNNGKTINLTIGDSDGDGFPDSLEIAEGTMPMNSLNYCFNCEIEINNVFATTNNLIAEVLFREQRLYGPVEQTNSTLTLSLGHIVVTNGERVVVYFWDDIDGDMVRDEYEPTTSVTVYARSHNEQYRYSLPHGGFDTNRDGLLDWWQLQYNLVDGAYEDSDCDGLVNLHEYWTGSNPLIPDGSNTVMSVMARSIDDRIIGRAANDISKCVYLNYTNSNMAIKLSLNTNCWAYGVDFTCASPWNATEGNKRAGTAISRRHVLFARHYALANREIYFRMGDGSVHTNSVIATRTHADSSIDIGVGLLAYDLPSAIRPAKILPQNYYAYIKDGHALPTLSFDQEEHALIHDVESVSSTVSGRTPSGQRLEFSEQIVGGDSGNPRFFVMGDDLIILNTFFFGGNGSGPSVRHYSEVIQQFMDQLSSSANLEASDYVLEEYNFGGFDQCVN